MDIVDLVKVKVSGTGVILPKEENSCDNECGCKLSSVDDEIERDNEQ